MAISVFEKNAKGKEQFDFPMQFSRGFEVDKKKKKWIDEWQKLPYVSPYENAAHLSSKSDESDKWAVGVLHELMHILVPKKTERENLLYLGECLGIRSRFKQALLHHPGIFYLSNKIGTYTVALREGYKRGVLAVNHPLMNMRSQYIHLMNTVKEESKTISLPGGSTQEKKKPVPQPKGKGEEEENDESEEEKNDESDEELEGELRDSSDAEDEYDGVDDDSDEEDEDQSQTNAVNNSGRRGRKSDFDGKEPSRNAERGRSGGRRDRKSDFDVKEPNRDAERGRTGVRRARKSDFDVKAPNREAERGSTGVRRAWKSDFDVKAPNRDAERGRTGVRRGWKSDFDVKAPNRNTERGRAGEQHRAKSRDAVSSETSRRTQTDVRHNIRQISRERSNFSQSKGRSLPDRKKRV